jgi:membrane-bound lytic murein transglycosylase A
MVLEDKNLEIAWARDPIDVFFLHIQGSGILRFENGEYIRVNYNGQNGRPYLSVGRMLIEQGKISSEGMSMAAIRKYLEEHPEELTRILYANPSYVFFRKAEAGSHGSIGVRLTAGRSVATDARLFPKGALVFLESKKPLLDGKGNIGLWKSYTRFGLNQDTGGAIRGPGRVDVFWGGGTFAQAAAGYTKQSGKLYFLVLKKGLAE